MRAPLPRRNRSRHELARAALRLGWQQVQRRLPPGASYRSRSSLASAWSTSSIASVGSAASVFSAGSALSAGSLLSVGSAGSILSIGSAGSILSIGSSGSFLSVGSAGARRARGRAGRGQVVSLEAARDPAAGGRPPSPPIHGASLLAVAALVAAAFDDVARR